MDRLKTIQRVLFWGGLILFLAWAWRDYHRFSSCMDRGGESSQCRLDVEGRDINGQPTNSDAHVLSS